ncbi:hypothetical protein D3C73_1337650 [compost metagenome]
MAEQPDHETHGELRDNPEDVGVDTDVQQRHDQEQLRDRQLGHAQQDDRDNRRHHHEQRVEDVVGGNHPRPLVLRCARLDQRVQRHNVETAEDAQAEDVEQHQPGVAETEDVDPAMAGGAVRNTA